MENENIDILGDFDITPTNETTNTSFWNTKEQNNTNNFIDLDNNEQDINNYIIFDEEDKKEKKEKLNIFSWIIFLFKYCLTSALIFWILLVSTNYVAYFNIVKSYFNKNEQLTETKWIISSVEAWTIKSKSIKKIIKNEDLINEENSWITQYSLKKLVNTSNKKDLDLNIEITPYDNRIVIPKISKNIPLVDIKDRKIEWGAKEVNNIFMKELENWVIRYPWSAKPWNHWNTFIFGHSSNFPWMKWDYNEVFALLDNVEYDDEIYIYYWQKKYKYVIREKKVISPWDVSILKRNKDKSELTLMTCWPIWTTLNRLIVTWELVE